MRDTARLSGIFVFVSPDIVDDMLVAAEERKQEAAVDSVVLAVLASEAETKTGQQQ